MPHLPGLAQIPTVRWDEIFIKNMTSDCDGLETGRSIFAPHPRIDETRQAKEKRGCIAVLGITWKVDQVPWWSRSVVQSCRSATCTLFPMARLAWRRCNTGRYYIRRIEQGMHEAVGARYQRAAISLSSLMGISKNTANLTFPDRAALL